MNRVLIVSGSLQGADSISSFLKSSGYQNITNISTGSVAKQRLAVEEYGLVIINTPLKDEFGHELAITVSQHSICGIILICSSDIADEMAEKAGDYGIYVVAKPLNRFMFSQSLKLAAATFSRMAGLKNENKKLQDKINEMRYINQAKYMLIHNLGYSEEEAHKYIERTAMDTRRTRLEVAKSIIDQYS